MRNVITTYAIYLTIQGISTNHRLQLNLYQFFLLLLHVSQQDVTDKDIICQSGPVYQSIQKYYRKDP